MTLIMPFLDEGRRLPLTFTLLRFVSNRFAFYGFALLGFVPDRVAFRRSASIKVASIKVSYNRFAADRLDVASSGGAGDARGDGGGDRWMPRDWWPGCSTIELTE